MSLYEVVEGQIIFRPEGDLTFFNVAPFSEDVHGAIRETGTSEVIIDCTHVKMLDSAAMGGLVQLASQIRVRNGRLKLANVGNSLRTGLQRVRMDKLFPAFDSVRAALNSLPQAKPTWKTIDSNGDS